MTISEREKTGKGLDTGQNEKKESLVRRLPKDALLITILVLSSTASFGLGVVAGREGSAGKPNEVFIEKPQGKEASSAVAAKPEPKESEPILATGGEYVASKTGTKYYLPWCGTAKRIKEENKVWFATKEEAEAEGYEPGKNCKGLRSMEKN